MLIDSHAHIYLDRFDADFEAVLERARAAGVERIVMPAIDVASIRRAIGLAEQYEGLYAMAAIHPSSVPEATEADLEAVAELCAHPAVVAVGESGLDYYWDRSFDAKQHDIFRWHIRLALEQDLPLILHLRDKKDRDEVHRDIVRLLDEERDGHPHAARLRGIFHCYTGPAWLADEAERLGFLLGIGGVVTFKNGGLDAVLPDVPLDRLVLETDAPYLAPSPHRGKRNEPAYTRLVAERLAEVKGVSVSEVARVTTKNAERLFGIRASHLHQEED